jgi:hypothetical protein
MVGATSASQGKARNARSTHKRLIVLVLLPPGNPGHRHAFIAASLFYMTSVTHDFSWGDET